MARQFEVTSEDREPEFFRNTLDAQIFACEQSEIRSGKFFIYDHSWQSDIPTHLYRGGRSIR